MDALEGPIKRRVQDELDNIDVEKLIHERIPDIAERARMLQNSSTTEDTLIDESTSSSPAYEPDIQEPFSDSDEENGES